MADSTRDFNITRNQIIESALRKVGALAPGEAVQASELDAARISLNLIVKEWQSRSVFLWTIQEQEITITSGNNSYVLDQDVIGLDGATYLDNTDDIPLEIISWRNYHNITDKDSVSNTPTVLAMKTEVETPTIYIYPTLSADVDIKLRVIKRLKDMDNPSDNPDIPSRWIRALIFALASDLAPEYSLDLRERAALTNEAIRLFKDAKTGDVEYQDATVVCSAFPK